MYYLGRLVGSCYGCRRDWVWYIDNFLLKSFGLVKSVIFMGIIFSFLGGFYKGSMVIKL